LKGKTKKRLLIALVIFVVLAIVATVASYFAVDRAFTKVSQSVGESLSGEVVAMPVVDENNTVVKDKTINVVLDEEKVNILESKVSVADKIAVLSILAKNLSKEDYQTLISYAVGGVTNEKLSKAMDLMRKKLSQEQKDQIKSYYAKYLKYLEE